MFIKLSIKNPALFCRDSHNNKNIYGKPENSSSFSTSDTYVDFNLEYSPFHAIMPHGRNPLFIEDGAILGLIIER